MELPGHKTKIVCTIGPACREQEILVRMLRQGMSVARLNFAHGTLEEHRADVGLIRSTAARLGRSCRIIADLPGFKIRVGRLQQEPKILEKDETIVLATGDAPGAEHSIPVSYSKLPETVSAGDLVFLNDGFIQLQVEKVTASGVECRVIVGGPLLSGKGLNLPGVRFTEDPVTTRDLELAGFALDAGIDTFGLSFVEKADDIRRIKEFARGKGKNAYVVAKIERAEAVANIEEILEVADAVMVARGDLGVQVPIEHVPAIQKELIQKANLAARPVITATQMLLSMTENIRPTRAEVSDVANAILDGTDAVMLSEETAIGAHPVEAVETMARIARSIEGESKKIREFADLREYYKARVTLSETSIADVLSYHIAESARSLGARFILALSGRQGVAGRISRFKPDCWTVVSAEDEQTGGLADLLYGVLPVMPGFSPDRGIDETIGSFAKSGLLKENDIVIVTEESSDAHGEVTDSFRIIRFREASGGAT